MTAEPSLLPPLFFADRRVEGAYPVTDPDGRLVARIHVRRGSTRSFHATLPDSTPLVSGRRRLRNGYADLQAPDGAALATLFAGTFRNRATVTLADGTGWFLSPTRSSVTWELTDADRRVLLDSQSAVRLPSLHPDGWSVRCRDRRITLALAVGIVETRRLWIKRRRSTD